MHTYHLIIYTFVPCLAFCFYFIITISSYMLYLFLLLLLYIYICVYLLLAYQHCGGVTCVCTCPKRRNINIVIQDSCTLSSLVNKCITICTPSIHLVVRLANPTTLVSDAGTVKNSKSCYNLLICKQECILLLLLLLFLLIIFILLLHCILYYSYSIFYIF